jgi:peptide/nickel transport system permease protein
MPIIVISAANFASAILVESGLSFRGAQPPMSWGSIIKDHYSYIILGKPYLAMVPGIAIMLITLAFMMMGNT